MEMHLGNFHFKGKFITRKEVTWNCYFTSYRHHHC